MPDNKKTLAALCLHRGYQVFLRHIDDNQRLDSADEAALYASEIEASLVGSDHKDWERRFGKENLDAWYKQFQWLSHSDNFRSWSKWSVQVGRLERYLKRRHFYQDPTEYHHLKRPKSGQPCYPKQKCLRYENPPSEKVGAAMLELVRKAGSAQAAIAFIERLIETNSDDFQMRQMQATEVFFDGRKPEQLARALQFATRMIVNNDIFEFINRVDEILDWSFSLRQTPTYLRFYKAYQTKGEHFFVELKRRREALDFFEDYDLADKIDERLLARIMTMDKEILSRLKTLVQKAGGKEFFNVYAEGKDDQNALGIFYRDSFVGRIDDFIRYLTTRGESFFTNIHQLTGIPGSPRLALMPLYNLIEALEQKGGDINAILPPLSPLLSVTKDHHEDNLTSLYWLHALYTDAFGRARVDSWDGKRAYPENLAKPILALAKDGKLDWAAKEVVRIFKSTRNYHREICLAQEPPFRCGQKRETTPYVWAQLFSLLSIELRDSRIVETDYSKADWKSKLFWLDQIERTDYNKGSGAFQFFMNNFVNSSYGNHLHKKAPSTSELDRLNRWIKRASNELPLFKNENLTEGEKITERFKHNLLSTLLLSQNGQVPSEAELEFFRQQAIRSNFVQKNTDSYYVTLYLYSRHLGNIWKDAPKTTQTIHHQFLTYSGGPYSLNSADDLRVALSDPQVQRELAEIERAITPLNPAERDQLLKFWQDKIPLSPMDYEKSEDLAKYLRRIRLLVSNSYQRTIAFILYVEPHIQDRGFFSFRGIETFLKFYSDHGEEKLKELLQGWEKIGLTLSNFTGEEKFLSLSENDEARISRIRPFAKYNLFLESSPLLKLTDQKFEKWFRFATRLKDQKINLSIASSLAIYDIPKINTFVKLLHDIGLFQRVVKSYSPLLLSQHFKILSKKALPLLCQNIGETKRILRRLKDQFKGYAFDEFNDPNNLLQSPVTAIHTLAALVHFELNADKMLFNAHRNPWDTYVTIVRDQRSSGKHAIYDYDPDYRFRIADYNLLRAISSKQLRSLMSGMDREELIESLLIQFAGLRIVPRQKNKLYASRESVSKALLDSLPLTELIRIQLLLNNVQDMTFRKPVHKAVEIDYDDIGGEHGGILLPAKNPEEIGSLYDPLLMNLLAGETHQTKSDIIRSLELQISNERDPQKRKVLERDLRMLTQGFDGGYNPPKRMLNSRFGWQFSLHFHAVKSHARGFRNKDLAGPSGGLGAGGDLGMTLLLGGGVVVTRLGKNHINADYYTLLPRYREGSPKAEYEALVIDLGEYKF